MTITSATLHRRSSRYATHRAEVILAKGYHRRGRWGTVKTASFGRFLYQSVALARLYPPAADSDGSGPGRTSRSGKTARISASLFVWSRAKAEAPPRSFDAGATTMSWVRKAVHAGDKAPAAAWLTGLNPEAPRPPDTRGMSRECRAVPSLYEIGGAPAVQSQNQPTNPGDHHAMYRPESESPSAAKRAIAFGPLEVLSGKPRLRSSDLGNLAGSPVNITRSTCHF